MITAMGLLAGLLTTLCWLPQLRRSWRTRSTRDISWLYLATLGAGIALWLGYGLATHDISLAAANVLTGGLVLLLICFKARFDHDLGRRITARRTSPGGAVSAVLLDMDGTLVQSDAAVERAWMRWADEYGVDPTEVEPHMHGNTSHATVRVVAPHLTDAAVQVAGDRQMALQYDDLHDVVAATGTDELMRVLDASGIPWAVVTSADRRLAVARLAAAGIEAPLVVTVDDVGVGKPDPEGYLLAARLLGVDARRCLVVEDSATGVTAGRRAGARVAGLRGTPADVAVEHLGEVADLLESTA